MGRSAARRWVSILVCGAVVLAVLASCTARAPSPRSSLPAQRAEPLAPRQPPVPPSEATAPSPTISPPQAPPPSAREQAQRTRPQASDDGRQRTRQSADIARSLQPAGRGGLVALDFDHADITAAGRLEGKSIRINSRHVEGAYAVVWVDKHHAAEHWDDRLDRADSTSKASQL